MRPDVRESIDVCQAEEVGQQRVNCATVADGVIRCTSCGLIQFATKDKCRRCKASFVPPEPEPEPVPVPPLVLADSYPVVNAGAAVKFCREALDLTQYQLAARMAVPRTYISKIENGRADPNIDSIERFAAALGLPTFFFVALFEVRLT